MYELIRNGGKRVEFGVIPSFRLTPRCPKMCVRIPANGTGATLMRAIFKSADLTNATLSDVTLWQSTLTDANLTGAVLTDANLNGANLEGANNLTQQQLDSACINKGLTPPTLPEGLKPPQKECVL